MRVLPVTAKTRKSGRNQSKVSSLDKSDRANMPHTQVPLPGSIQRQADLSDAVSQLKAFEDQAAESETTSTLTQLRKNADKWSTENQASAAQPKRVGLGFVEPSSNAGRVQGHKVVQRNKTSIGKGYYRGEKELFTLSGHDGVFFKSNTGYKKVKPTGAENSGLKVYEPVDPAIIVQLDERTEREKFLDAVGPAEFGGVIMFPSSRYPHLSVEFSENGTLQLGDAHYSGSYDDIRISYPRVAGKWVYASDSKKPIGFETKKQAADIIIAKLNQYFAP